MARDEVLISVEALDALDEVDLLDVRWRLGEPQGGGRERYLSGHLPGARFLDLETVLTRHGTPAEGRHPLPDAGTLAAGLGALGVSGDKPIVVYDEAGSFAASRAWWVLRWAGLDARVLDGGIAAWTAQNRPLASGDAVVEPVALDLTVDHLPTIDADAAADFDGTLMDARAPERYRGETEPIDPVAGHIPGAVNVPVAPFFTADGRLPDDDALRDLLDRPGPLGAYCGSGVSAAQLVLAAAAIDHPVALYPGSWSAWSNQGRPVATGGRSTVTYPTTATTLLGNIEANLRGVRARVGDRLVLAAVKANAYGHGAVAVASMIERTGAADWLGVATVAEGVELRDGGVTLPILKLSPVREDDDIEAALARGITLSVVDAASVDQLAAAAQRLGLSGIAVHLKVDTGMRRVGVEPEDAPALARRVTASGLRLQGVFSHLPISDHPAGVAFTCGQRDRFAGTVTAIEDAVGPVELKHLANSGAVLGHPDTWFDLVRPGIMIYGSLPDPEAEPSVELRPGLELTTAITFVKRVEAGETVSYGRTWTSPRDSWIATVPVGYGDGYSRLLSNRGRVLIGGRSHPIAGRVCMDQTMIDLGPEPVAQVGDEVVLIGRRGDAEITVEEIAQLMGTIPYEVTCLLTSRVTRAHS